MVQSNISGTIEPIWLKFVLMCEFWLVMATKKFQPDQLNSSGDIALDHKGTFGLERGTIGLERQKIFLHYLLDSYHLYCSLDLTR